MLPEPNTNMKHFIKEQILHWENYLKNNPQSLIRAKVELGLKQLKNMI